MEYRIRTAGDSALLIEFEQEIKQETNQKIKAILQWLKEQSIEGILDMVPAFASLLISYDPRLLSYDSLINQLDTLLQQEVKESQVQQRIIEIPVCYGGAYGPDLSFVAQNAGLTETEVIARHTSRDYLIYMLGFLPGFPYLGGLDETIHTPRLENPRLTIAAGSVGIGGSQTGIYPMASPGGWRLIGRTPLKTYDPQRQQPFIFGAGDYIRFKVIDESDYDNIYQAVLAGNYEVTVLTGEEVRDGH